MGTLFIQYTMTALAVRMGGLGLWSVLRCGLPGCAVKVLVEELAGSVLVVRATPSRPLIADRSLGSGLAVA